MSAQWTFELQLWEEENRGYIVKLAEKYAPLWGITFDDAKAWIYEELPKVRSKCKGQFTGAYLAQSLLNKRKDVHRKEATHNADIAHGANDLSDFTEILTAKEVPHFDADGQVLMVSRDGACTIVTVSGGEMVGSIGISGVKKVMIEADEEQIRVIDCG